jgi:hypothetical protein
MRGGKVEVIGTTSPDVIANRFYLILMKIDEQLKFALNPTAKTAERRYKFSKSIKQIT